MKITDEILMDMKRKCYPGRSDEEIKNMEEKFIRKDAIKERFWNEFDKQNQIQNIEDFDFTIDFSGLGATEEEIEEVLDEMRVEYYREDEKYCYNVWGDVYKMKPDEVMFDLNEDGIELWRFNNIVAMATNSILEIFKGTWEEAIKAAEETIEEWAEGK